eukprot:PITA_20476
MIELIETKPSTFEEVVEKLVWVDEMVEEYESIMKNSVWEVVPRLADKSIVGSRWIFKVKQGADRSVEKCKMGKNIHQMDVKTSFLSGVIEEEVYIEQPKGFETFDRESHVCKLKGAVYGLNDEKLIRSYNKDLARKFNIRDMGLMHYFLVLEVWQGDGELFLSQEKYPNKILKRFRMDKCRPMETPPATNWREEDVTSREEVNAIFYQQLVSSLMYLVNT